VRPRIESLHHLSTVSLVTPQGHARCVRLRIDGHIARPGTGCSYPAKDDADAKADDPSNNDVSPFAQKSHRHSPLALASLPTWGEVCSRDTLLEKFTPNQAFELAAGAVQPDAHGIGRASVYRAP
jgi:hypothetical protein